MLVWQLCPKCFEGHFWTATKKSELYFMPVFKQKCVFVIHDVEDKLILWKKNTVWFQKGHWNPGCFQKRLCVRESEAEARLQLSHSLVIPGSRSWRGLQLTCDSEALGIFSVGFAESVIVFNYTASIAQQPRCDLKQSCFKYQWN